MSHSQNTNPSIKRTGPARKTHRSEAKPVHPTSEAIARKGLRTASDVVTFGLATVVDVVLGALRPQQVSAAANMLGKVSKFVDMQEAYGKADRQGGQKKLHLLPAE